jgi:antitoxin (DNA-binding transcriptional repressor) of toxin-antitoxin stability system
MKIVGIRELKNRLSEYVRLVRQGEEIQVTHRGEVVAELRPPGAPRPEEPYPGLQELIRRGEARRPLGPNNPDLYPRFERALTNITAAELLDQERGER